MIQSFFEKIYLVFFPSSENSKKVSREVMWVLFLVTSMVILVRLEKRLYVISQRFSDNPEFIKTLSYFMLVNIHVILALFLGFVLFRYLARLITERRRGVIGSHLKTKLMAAFVFFALVPSGLVVFVSTQFITKSLVGWFSSQSAEVMDEVRQVGEVFYKQDRKRLSSLAQIAQHRFSSLTAYSSSSSLTQSLKGFVEEYQITALKIYNVRGLLRGSSLGEVSSPVPYAADQSLVSLVDAFSSRPRRNVASSVSSFGGKDVVRGVAPLYEKDELVGFVVSEEEFPKQVWSLMESALGGFERLRSSSQILKINYMVLMLLTLLVIVFCGVWLSVRVARGIVGPFQSLARATREVALGNYKISLPLAARDETGALVEAFNMMVRDLERHEDSSKEHQRNLERLNVELLEKSSNLEVVLGSITSGVVTLGASGCVEHMNLAAEKLLKISMAEVLGKKPREAFSHNEKLWGELEKGVSSEGVYFSSVEDSTEENRPVLLARAAKILGKEQQVLGTVVVLDDASHQILAQKSIAWRDVAKRIAHEIKNPITPIKLNAERLQRRFAQSFEAEDREVFSLCVQGIISQVDTLRDLVHEFTRFARLPKAEKSKGDIMPLIREIFYFYKETYGNISWQFSESQPSCEWVFDGEQIRRALMNLFLNSIEALSGAGTEDPCISLDVEEGQGFLRIRVQDNGPGVEESMWSQVGEAYVSTKPHGSGLGLAIVRQIASDHQGTVVLSRAHPQGLCVLLSLAKDI